MCAEGSKLKHSREIREIREIRTTLPEWAESDMLRTGSQQKPLRKQDFAKPTVLMKTPAISGSPRD
jgi:hypothetical protein